MGRAVLKALKDSTLLTFFEICAKWGLVKDLDYKYNSIDGIITFIATGSTIYLKDLFQNPSDPEFADLGSREFTGIFIDEGAEITIKAFNIAKSRVRFKLEEFGLVPKILICSNPCKNFLYYDFYKPHRNNTLPKYRKFLPALAKDNPYISPHYIENLKKLDPVSKERLLYGNWEYDDDLSKLFEYDKIIGMFTNINTKGKDIPYLTVDVGRYGNDPTIMMKWSDLAIKKIYIYKKQSLLKTREAIEERMNTDIIPSGNIIVDEDGIGGGIVDEMRIIQGFVNNSRPIELKPQSSVYTKVPRHNFANLKSQCYFYLAKLVNAGEIEVYKDIPVSMKEMMVEDLEQIKQKDIDKDGKLAIIPKQEIKKSLGRSTDYGDAMMMRMFFELKGQGRYIPYISV